MCAVGEGLESGPQGPKEEAGQGPQGLRERAEALRSGAELVESTWTPENSTEGWVASRSPEIWQLWVWRTCAWVWLWCLPGHFAFPRLRAAILDPRCS